MEKVDLDIQGNTLHIRFPFSAEMVEKVKTITSDYRKRDRAWVASAVRLDEIYAVFPDAKASPKLLDWVEAQRRGQACKTGDVNGHLPWCPESLLPHQKSALAFLAGFKRAALLDPPGTGKTRTAIVWANQFIASGPVLIVCPAAVKFHWRREILALGLDHNPVVLQGIPKAFQGSDIAKIGESNFTVINYDILRDWLPVLPPVFKTLIADEAHYAKEAKSRRGEAVQAAAKHVENLLFVTGSPALNRPAELESMLVALGYLTPRERFAWRLRFCDGQRVCINEKGVKYQHREPEFRWQFKGASNVELLARELDTFSVRRPFSALATSLPPVTHTLMEVDLPSLRDHDKWWAEMKKGLKSGDPQSRGKALGLLGTMISWCAAQKVDIVRGLVAERLEVGESPVVFCDFLEPLDLLRALFPQQSAVLDGRMSQSAREQVVRSFVQGSTPTVLLASRRACGTGLDGLQHRARSVIFLNPSWTPEGWHQAWARVAREGQRQPVEVITTLARGTVEEAVLSIIYRKAKVTDILCSSPALTEESRRGWEEALSLLGGL